MSQTQSLNSLYERDILLWSEDTVAKLKARDFDHLDIEHLIEEVESLGISQRKELISRLIVLLEHLLKRLYVNLPDDYNGWERTIRTQQGELEILLDAVPSLTSRWDFSFDKAWQIAPKNVRKEYTHFTFPLEWKYDRSIEPMLNRDFWLESSEENS
ncbi:DUF29 domain-containing protein [Nodosilinea sp. PGN35]|uniref:DUF29 domain-containing protein n=1 Tax=Nodosilinea sp. PGN35 TaxID=3020489 RepID=UPI0023B2F46B|nr:DUF29 domain-containing protein [Nodosilinea sp. TSF1-S3]